MYNLDAMPKSLLTYVNPKTAKGEGHGYLTAILHFAPADRSGRNVCPHATAGCRAACLNEAGRGGIGLDADGLNTIQAARIRRTRWWARDRERFLEALVAEAETVIRKAERHGLKPALRPNGTSDLPWERWPVTRGGIEYANIMRAFPEITFYDYTKWPIDLRRKGCPDWPSNYHLTFSLAEDNHVEAERALAAGVNVAVPFTTLTSKITLPTGERAYRHSLPPSVMVGGRIAAVIDGDQTDLRFLDGADGVVVGLRAKGNRRLVEAGRKAGFILAAN